jgi:hypothetical protein
MSINDSVRLGCVFDEVVQGARFNVQSSKLYEQEFRGQGAQFKGRRDVYEVCGVQFCLIVSGELCTLNFTR